MKIEFERTGQRGHPSKTWWDCVKRDMESFGLSCVDADNRESRRKLADPGLPGKRPLKRCVCVTNSK